MAFPNRFKISAASTEKLKFLKSKTGVTPNILCRFAISLAIRDSKGIGNASTVELNGQDFNAPTLFGDNLDIYEVLVRQYMQEHDVKDDVQRCVAAMVEIGLHKMGHVRSIRELASLAVK